MAYRFGGADGIGVNAVAPGIMETPANVAGLSLKPMTASRACSFCLCTELPRTLPRFTSFWHPMTRVLSIVRPLSVTRATK